MFAQIIPTVEVLYKYGLVAIIPLMLGAIGLLYKSNRADIKKYSGIIAELQEKRIKEALKVMEVIEKFSDIVENKLKE